MSDAIVQQIVDLISTNALKPGDRLPPERTLCKTLGVGRTSLREALKPLLTMGILEGRGSAGTFVAEGGQFLEKTLEWGLKFDPKQVEDIIETRMMLETHAAYWAAIRATPEDLSDMDQSLAVMRNSLNDVAVFRDADVKFHVQIAQATQNSILISLVNMMRQYFVSWIQERLSANPIGPTELAEISLIEHQAILDKIIERDGDGARNAMAAHIGTASTDLRAHMRDTDTDK
ncbi:MAG: FadR/GntR family transcriptional regulator [Proteobacteria bacterium]|nr:FadR/GntR family transcriptional regulator [Pseudomonadota bacterium]